MNPNDINPIHLATNNAEHLQINVTATVNSKQITRETLDGRDYYVLPSFTLPANVVMNRVMYPEAEIDKHYKGLEGTLAPLGHPVVNGKAVAAATHQGLTNYCGAANRNVQKMGNRIYLEKWVDIEQAEMSANGRKLLDRIKKIQDGTNTAPIHSSVALFINRKPVETPNGEYDAVAEILKMDHDAILLDEPGAATPEQGVGLMVNSDNATQLVINEDLLPGEYRMRERHVAEAAQKQFGTQDDWVHVAGLNDSQVVLHIAGKKMLYDYAVESGNVKFGESGQEVTEKSLWVMATNVIKRIFNPQAQKPAQKESSDMNAEERAAFLAEVQSGVATIVANAIKPVQESVTALQANQETMAKQIAAPALAAEESMRAAVKAVHGEVVANALSGAALADLHSKLPTAAGVPLDTNSSKQAAATDEAALRAHFGVK